MDKIEHLIAVLIAATDNVHLARERQAEAVEALRYACMEALGVLDGDCASGTS